MSAFKEIVADSHLLSARKDLQKLANARAGQNQTETLARVRGSLQGLVSLEGTADNSMGPIDTLLHDLNRVGRLEDTARTAATDAASSVVIERPTLRLAGVAGNEEAKAYLRRIAVYFFGRFPEGIRITRARRLCFAGVPGVGKTHMVRGLAGELGCAFLCVKPADVHQPLHGLSGRRIKEIFNEARLNSPSILFFDELEAYGARISHAGDSPASNEVLQALKLELEEPTEAQVFVVGSSNAVWDIDDAILSRFETLVIGLPDSAALAEIWRLEISSTVGLQSEVSWNELANASLGRTGREISMAAKMAVDAMIDRLNPELARGDRPMDLETLAQTDVLVGPVTPEDYDLAIQKVPARTPEWMLDRLQHWSATSS